MSQSSPAAAEHSHTLDRGLRALEVLRGHPDGLSVTELARELGTHRAAVYRLLGPLVAHRLVQRLDDGRCVLGPGLIALAEGVQPRLIQAATPVLRALAARLGATTALTIRDGNEAVVALVLTPPDQPVHVSYRIGLRHPLTVGSPGHALLAAGPPQPGEPEGVAAVRQRGWTVSSGELLPGATGVAALVPARAQDTQAAVSAVWIVEREVEPAAREVVAAAAEIAAVVGRQ
ncbi:MAG TPA: helix-turn-helix domain-containing protein [Solirubrobacteraceae bacterium]|jgi:DNA-binding IclR family transcriptional regulator